LFAVVTAIFAYLAFRSQSAEVSTLQEQLREQQKLNCKQIEVIDLQVQELHAVLAEHTRQAEGRRRLQASKVFFWEEHLASDPLLQSGMQQNLLPGEAYIGVFVVAHVVNSSDQPVYDAELRWHRGSTSWGEPNPEPLPTIMPGKEVTRVRQFPRDTNMTLSGIVLGFRDAAGVEWLRHREGKLVEREGQRAEIAAEIRPVTKL